MKKLLGLVALSAIISGCTSIKVNSTDGFQPKNIKQICVITNPKVSISGFDQSVVQSFARYNISARFYPENSKPALCETTMTYTALRSWDIVTYMSYAKFTLMKDGVVASEAEFALRGKGGLALNKWRSTDTKIDELVDQLVGTNKTKQ